MPAFGLDFSGIGLNTVRLTVRGELVEPPVAN